MKFPAMEGLAIDERWNDSINGSPATGLQELRSEGVERRLSAMQQLGTVVAMRCGVATPRLG